MGRSIILVLVLAASTASAQDEGAPSTEQRADAAASVEADSLDSAARNLFEAGRLAYSEARYEDALQRFQQAYDISQRPGLLYNIGQALDRLRRDQEAIATWRRFLETDPPEAQRQYVVTRLEALEAHAPTPSELAASNEPDPDEPDPYIEEPPPESSGPRWGLIAAIIGAVVVVSVAVAVPLALRDTDPDYVEGNVGGVIFTLGRQ